MYKIYTRKLLRIMRITIVILIATIMQVSASSYAQKITLSEKNASLTKVLEQIRTQSGYDFLFKTSALDDAKPVSIRVKNAELKDVLELIFQSQPLEYEIAQKSVMITSKTPSFLDRVVATFAVIDVRGRVLDEQGNPLAGATITVKGTRQFTSTNRDGAFTLSNVSDEASIVISFLGYESFTFKAKVAMPVIKLKAVEANLQEVVINKGYYTTTQKLNTGSVVKVTGEQLTRQPLTNPIQALEGLVPGMFIQQSSGMAGSATTVLIRGRSSLGSVVRPFYVVDGVPFNGAAVDSQVGAGGLTIGSQPNGSTDPLNSINPSDIESITILKDADATALYGSRGSNGVVLITTKSGVSGKSRLNANVSKGFGKIVNQLPLISMADFLAIRRQAFVNDNRTPTAALSPDLMLWDQNASTDYQDMLIGNTSEITEATASYSGGNDGTTFLLSGTYHDEGTVLKGDFGFSRGSINMKLNHKSDNGKFKIDFGSNYIVNKNVMPANDFTSNSIQTPQNLPIYNPDGTLYWFSTIFNPSAIDLKNDKTDNTNLNFNGSMGYAILPNLNLKARFGHNVITQDQRQLYPIAASNPAFGNTPSGTYASNNTKTYIAEPQLDYNANIWKGKLSATVGGSWQHTRSTMAYLIAASAFPSDALLESFAAAGTISTTKSMSSEYKYLSTFGILNYNIKDKYILNAAFRRDGSSRFGTDRKFGNFGSVGAAWILSEESLIKNLNLFSFLKLRGSYGITGNDQTDNYTYLDTYTAAYGSYGGAAGFYATRISNPVFSWEENKKAEVNLDMGFLNDRLNFSTAYFHNRSDNMVTSVSTSTVTGFPNFITNLDALIQNAGFELMVSGTPVKTKDITWTASLNLTRARNKLLRFPTGLASSYNMSYIEGRPLGLIRAYKFTGFNAGVAQFADLNNDGKIAFNLLNDMYDAGSTDPDYYGGFTTSFRYKKLQVDILVNFVKQLGTALTSYPGRIGSLTEDVLNSPFIPSALTTGASYTSYNSYYLSSDAVIVDASYLRLRNLSISYGLPDKWSQLVKARNAGFFLRGQNLFTITPYKGFDPETRGTTLPPLKVFTLGFQCTF